MRVSVRFDVFKRDGFACQYCGRKTPDVVLEVDHVIPRAEGGTDDPENLVTACWDCNRGKGARLLDDRAPVRDLTEQTELIRERAIQLRAYHQAVEEARQGEDERFQVCWNHWFELWDTTELERWQTPGRAALKKYVELLGVSETNEAMDITRDKFGYPTARALSYLFGTLKRKAGER